MKTILCLGFLFLVSGCSTISGIASSAKNAETEQTGDPVYDSQNEVQLLLPWTWFL